MTPEQALAIVRERHAQPRLPDGTHVPLAVHEFDTGYVVYADFPTGTEDGRPPRPAPPGGSVVVVAKDTGECVVLPAYPNETAVELYRRRHRRARPQNDQ